MSDRAWKITDRLICEARLVVNMANEWNSRPREISAAWAHVFDFAREVLAGTAGQPSADVFMDWRNVVDDARKLDHSAELVRLRSLEWKAKAAGFIDEKGEVRQVLGTLPLTADGMVAGMKCELWADFAPAGVDAPTQCAGPGWPCVPMSRLYGSREAADEVRRRNEAILASMAKGGA